MALIESFLKGILEFRVSSAEFREQHGNFIFLALHQSVTLATFKLFVGADLSDCSRPQPFADPLERCIGNEP